MSNETLLCYATLANLIDATIELMEIDTVHSFMSVSCAMNNTDCIDD